MPTPRSLILRFVNTTVSKASNFIENTKEKYRVPSKKEHYLRDAGEIPIAPNLESAKELNAEGKVIFLKKKESIYHLQGHAENYNPRNNTKVITLDGLHETVYNELGEIVTDSVNRGTKNWANPKKTPIQHFLKEMVPYFLWGNSEDDPTTIGERITASYNGDVNANKEESWKERRERLSEKMLHDFELGL